MMRKLDKVFFLLAGVLAAAASIYIALAPLTVITQTAQNSGSGETLSRTTEQISWYAAQGLWGIAILVIFAGLYSGTAWSGINQRWKLFAIGAPLALILTFLAGFSIGAYYLPAAASLLLGSTLVAVKRIG